jgi:23S rRNA G2445 N2-methylase RlmL
MKKFRFEYFASCPVGIEEVLEQEILKLGPQATRVVRGGVQFDGFHEVALKVILYSRTASRVFKYLYQFEVENEKDYYLEATQIKWKSLMSVDQTFKLTTIFGDLPFGREEFRNSQFANLKLKDAIVDWFRHHENNRPSVAKEYPDVVFLARVEQGRERPYEVTILYDLCGSPLNQRGYRIAQTPAPIKENVAAALLMLGKWNPEEEILVDAMCGSGTIAIEAALIACDIPPSYLKVERFKKIPSSRPWAFLNYTWFTKDNHLQENLKSYIKDITERSSQLNSPSTKHQIYASDISQFDLDAARDNFDKAGLNHVIKSSCSDALLLRPFKQKTLFICNPPYGERLEHQQDEKLKLLYKSLGDLWKQSYKGHRSLLLTGNLEMLKHVGLRTSKRHILFNGDIECRLAEYTLY